MKERIRKLRRTLDLTQQEFADRIGIKRNTIANYEIGRNDPVDSVIALICREFNVNETWLRTGEGEMFVQKKDDALTELSKRHGLSEEDRILIEKYVNLPPKSRETIINFMVDVVSSLDAAPPKVLDPTTATKEEKMAAYERFLDEKEKTDASVSNL